MNTLCVRISRYQLIHIVAGNRAFGMQLNNGLAEVKCIAVSIGI